MRTTNWIAGILTGALLMAGAFCVPAAAKAKEVPEQQPISIEADELYFSDKTGEMFARGNVIITQAQTRIFAELLRGNDKNTEIWADGKIRYTDLLTDLTGTKIRYNYGSKFGTMRDVKGRSEDIFVSGAKVDVQQGKYTVYSATATTCPSVKVPDYRVTARKVDIWPGVKMIAYDAKLWIKNMVIYSTPRYKKSLDKKDDSGFPRLGYDSKDGLSVSQYLSYALTENLTAYTDLAYFTHTGFHPTFGLFDQEKEYSVRLMTGRVKDYNNNWIWKQPELNLELYSRRIGTLPFKYTVDALFGQWKDSTKTSWHQDYTFYVNRDPLFLDARKTWTLNLGAGYQYVHESYDDSSHSVFRYNIRLEKKLSPAVTAWTAYNYSSNTDSLFAYNRVDVPQEGIVGFSWKINNRTTVGYAKSYDFGRHRTYDDYYILKQNFHCWDIEFTYRAVKKELNMIFSVVKW